MTKLRALALPAVVLAFYACSSEKMSGTSSTASHASHPAGSSPGSSSGGTAGGGPTIGDSKIAGSTPGDASNLNLPHDCGPDGATQATLISKTLKSGANNYLDYQLSLTDCQGQVKPFSADTIWFDVNGAISNFGSSINFSASDGQSPPVSGAMRNVIGSDLFNHQGYQWAHWETNQAVSFSATKNSITFRVFLGGATITSLDKTTQVATYLKFGKAAPVMVVVQLLN